MDAAMKAKTIVEAAGKKPMKNYPKKVTYEGLTKELPPKITYENKTKNTDMLYSKNPASLSHS